MNTHYSQQSPEVYYETEQAEIQTKIMVVQGNCLSVAISHHKPGTEGLKNSRRHLENMHFMLAVV